MNRNRQLVVGSVVSALSLNEAYLWLRADEILPMPSLCELDPDVGKRMEPGWTGGEFEVRVGVKLHGLRSGETTWEKPPNPYRILDLERYRATAVANEEGYRLIAPKGRGP